MVRTIPLANALGTVAAALYLVCAAAAALWPDALLAFFQTWFHGVQMSAVTMGPAITFPAFLFGLASFTASTWAVAAATAWLYNAWSARAAAS